MLGRIIIAVTILLSNHAGICQVFVDLSVNSGINFVHEHDGEMGGGAAFFDYDQDGDEDVYITGGLAMDKLYQNNGNGTFTDVSIAAGLSSTDTINTHGVTTGDIDNDGYREIFLTTWNYEYNDEVHTPNLLYKNNGDGTFTEISAQAGVNATYWSTSATFGDFDLDGLLDLYVGNYVDSIIDDAILDTNGMEIGYAHIGYQDILYLNNGNGTFTDKTLDFGLTAKGSALAVASTDYNEDGIIDLMVANDFGEFTVRNKLYENPSFIDVSAASGADVGIYGMGIGIGDYDEDNDLDYYITNLGRNVLLQNQGDGTFQDVTTFANVENTYVDTLLTTGWGTFFLDYDNDSHLDLFVSNGRISAAAFIRTGEHDPNKLYHNNQDGTFTDVSDTAGVADINVGRGATLCDYDNDGDLDMLVVVHNEYFTSDTRVRLYNNQTNSTGGNWVKVDLEGVLSNRDAYGAHVRVHADGRTFLREVGGGSSHSSQNSSIQHVGLGTISSIDSVVIKWPGGRIQRACNVPINQTLQMLEDTTTMNSTFCNAVSTEDLTSARIGLHSLPNPFTSRTTIHYELPHAAAVELIVMDVLGNQVQTLFSGKQSAGKQSADFTIDGHKDLAVGVYFCSLTVNGNQFMERIVLLK